MKNTPKRKPALSRRTNRFLFTAALLAICAHNAVAQQWTGPDGSNNISNANSGNVGVGTTAPQYKLDLANVVDKAQMRFGLGALDSGGFLFSNAPSHAVFSGGASWNGGWVAKAMSASLFQANNGAITIFGNTGLTPGNVFTPTARLSINPSGNIGVGTESPSQRLNVIGNGLFGNLTTRTMLYSGYDSQQNPFLELGYETSHSVTTPFPTFILSNHTTSTSNTEGVIGQLAFANRSIADTNEKRTAAILSWVDGASNSGTLQFYTTSAGTIGERLRITPTGNVGLGTISPKTRFDIKQSSDTFVGGLHLRRAATNDTWAIATGADNSLYMGYANNASGADAAGDFAVYPLVLTSAGNVGINKSDPNPAYKLDVNGEINATGFRINGTPISGGGGPTAFSSITTGTNLTSLLVGPGGSLNVTGTGTITATSLADNGANLTALNATNLATGTVAPARLGSGTANSSTFLRGDNTWAPLTSSQWANGSGSINYTSGNVGIGTSGPSDALQIDSGGWGLRVRYTGDGQYLRLSANQVQSFTSAGTGRDLYLNSAGGNVGIGTASPASGYKLDVNGNANVTGNLNATGTIEGGNIKAKYQDLAEWVPSSEELSAGTVVVLDTTKSNQVIASAVGYDTRVAGVISAQPGITLGEEGEGKVLVATTGRVRVKVDASRGPIQIGDLLVTSDVAGVAMKSEAVNLGGVQIHRPGTIIGKALEPLANGKGEILVLLSLQ